MAILNIARDGIIRAICLLFFALLVSAGIGQSAHAQSATSNGITFSDVSLQQAQRGVVYETMPGADTNLNALVSGGTSPYSYAITAGALPDGLFLSSSGQLTGVNCISKNGSYPFTVAITDSSTPARTGTFNLSINMTTAPAGACALTLSATNLVDSALIGTSYTNVVSATGGAGSPYTFSLAGGSLPPGVILNATGTLSGTPTTAGTYTFNVRASDTAANTGYATVSITVSAGASVVVGPASLPSGTNGSLYSQVISPTGGTGPYVCVVSAGSLPAGISLTNNTLTGTPTTAGDFTFTITCTDANGVAGSRTYSMTVDPGQILVLGPASLPNATNGTAYTQTVVATGGTGTGYVFTVDTGSLPTGVTLSADGAITGTPTAAGSYTFMVRAVDSAGNFQTKSYTIVVDPGAVLTLAPASLPNAASGSAYTQTIVATGGTGTGYVYTVTSGALPTGLNLSAAGAITGTPTAAGTYTFTVRAVDSAGNFQTKEYVVTVVAVAVGPASLPSATNGTAYSQAITPTGGTGPYVCVVSAGALPAGITLTSNTLSGTPTAAGSYTFTITCTDANGVAGSRPYSMTVDAGQVLVLGPATLPNATNGTAYTQSVVATGGTGTGYVYTVDAGSLPTGLTLSAGGAITGTPTVAGSYTFTVRAADSAGNFQTKSYTLVIEPGAVLTLGPASLPKATNGAAYTQSVVATGGTGTGYVYSLTSGTLPTGLTLSAAGAVAGTPSAAGSYTFTVRAVDSAGNFQTKTYTVVVDPGAVLNLGPQTLNAPTQGVAYSGTVVATGGSGTGYVYSIDSGALPSGLTLNPTTGAITGKTLGSGTFTFTVRAVDSQGNWGLRTYTFTIRERPDPSKDAEVIALIDGQFRSAGRFAEAQVSNAMRHMESLHGGLRCGISNNLNIAAGMPANVSPGSSDANAQSNAAAGPNESPVAFVCDEQRPTVSLWTAGSINRENTNVSRLGSEALTVGLDYQVTDKLIIGGAAGFGWGDNQYGRNGTSSKDQATTAMAYASMGMSQNVFIDVALGKTWVDFSGQRYVTSDASIAQFDRKGDVVFGSAALTLEQPVGQFLLAGQMRYDYTDISLDAFSEVSASSYALSYDAASQSTQAFTWGVRGQTTFVYDWGNFTPIARVEMRHRIDGSYDQLIRYSDLLTRAYTLRQDMAERGAFSASIGGRLSAGSYEMNFEYGSSSTSLDTFEGSEIRVGFKKKF